METFIVQPKNQNERNAIEAFFRELNITFKTEDRETLYDADFVAKIKRGDEDVARGRTTTITLDDIWK
ncbi:hypothetical protein J2Y45_000533 [Dyadobacter sp. BE34]|uniref:Uncharacterized protein n=1 Tax=Dyadobacter fermentans TaxID=94254 RepID=A0ABU1QQ38_9BACT|nr:MULTISPECIES: DUF2683 family protein [Dyadobacter]MDR6803263.1 hypothetical protein [Dyadobacter fermentans]MDR7041004.1 hypothetical protein [Dyadobacter sp. BE242]MDR7195407.1 hypothetical protein [Dyadobacter sp. BE34]MDR7214048.1 hypothetical protein [Dyadobacter sp. BE31]MDR7260814.1 hypothetical protein [Dyadobacter sp. BE32]